MFYPLKKLVIACILAIGAVNAEQVVILGSGPAGLTAAIYASRGGLSTLVIEGDDPGGQIALSYMVENYPGFPEGISGFDLVNNMREQAMKFGAKMMAGHIVSADLSKRPFTLKMTNGQSISADTLIIASGASAKWLGLESEQALIGNGVGSCAVCDGILFRGKEVVVVGGGDTALEDALFLAKYASQVTVVHRRDILRASKYLQEKAFANSKIKFVWNSEVIEIADPTQKMVTGVKIKNLMDNRIDFMSCQGVFIAIGFKPNTDVFEGLLALTPDGLIVTSPASTKTNVEGVFAAGDVADPRFRQAITAAGTGCMAGIEAYHFIQEFDQ